MKTIFFRKNHPSSRMRIMRLALLLLPLLGRGLGGGGALFAQDPNGNGVKVENLEVGAGTVTFNVSWDKNKMPEVWVDSAWVFVDYNKNGVMERLPLIAGATLTTTSAEGVGKVIEVSGNNQGVWVAGNARSVGNFSATVKLLTATANLAGVCAYASNYPPMGEYIETNVIKFTGTAPYTVMLKDNPTPQVVGSNDYSVSGTVESFTDKTGAPGRMKCKLMTGDITFTVPATTAKGQPVTFTRQEYPTLPENNLITYTWSAPDFTPTSGTGTSYAPTAPGTTGTYPVTLTVRSEGYCDKSKTEDVTVIECNPSTVYNLQASATGYCVGEDRVTFALDGTEIGRTYQLLRGNDVVSTLTGTGSAATFSDNADITGGLYTAKVTATADGHCEMAMNGSYNISENSAPGTPTITKPAAVCQNGGNLVFTVESHSGTLVWTSYDAGGEESGNSVTFNSSATGTKTVTARTSQTYTNGAPTCYSTTVTQSAVVNAVPAAPTGTNGVRCGSGTVTLSATRSGAVIDWYSATSGGTSLTTGTSYTPNITSSATYYAEARIEATGCISASRTAITATMNAAPTAPTSLGTNVTTICNGVSTSATLTAGGGDVGSGAVYEWGTGTVGNNLLSPSTTTAATRSVTLSAATTYWVQRRGTGACSATTTGGVTKTIAVYSAVSPGSITTASTTTKVNTNPNKTIENSATATGGSGSITYQWRRSGTSSATLTGNTATYTLSSSTANYSTAGTYRFNRYAKDATCSNAAYLAAAGTYTLYVEAADFYSSSTWRIGGYTWSDRVVAEPSGCAKRTTLVMTTGAPPGYIVSAAGNYFYNWYCAQSTQDPLCPYPWRLPSSTEIAALQAEVNQETLAGLWGYSGYAAGQAIIDSNNSGIVWSSEPLVPYEVYDLAGYVMLWVRTWPTVVYDDGTNDYFGLQVRCVKD